MPDLTVLAREVSLGLGMAMTERTRGDGSGGLVRAPRPHLYYKEPYFPWDVTTGHEDLDHFRSLHCVRQVLRVQQSFSAGGQKHFPDVSCSSSTRLEKELLCWQAGEHKAPKQMFSLKSGTSPCSQGVCEVLKHQIQSILGNETNSSWWKTPPTEDDHTHGSTPAPVAGAWAPSRESSLKLATIFFFPPATCSTMNSGFQLKLLTVAGVRDTILGSYSIHMAINASVLTQWPRAVFWPHTSFPPFFCFGTSSPVNF